MIHPSAWPDTTPQGASSRPEACAPGTHSGSITYADVTPRDWALDTGDARFLRQHMPAKVWDRFCGCFLDADTKSADAQFLWEYLVAHSEIAKIVNKDHSSAEAFEYFYERARPRLPIDRYFVESLAGRHITKRLRALEMHLPRIVAGLPGESVRVDNLFSGPGYDMISVLRADADAASRIRVRNVDSNPRALERARAAAEDAGCAAAFEFANVSLSCAEPRAAHLILLIGVLCTMPKRATVKLLRLLRRYCHPEGLIVYSTNQPVMAHRDPFTDFAMRLAGWSMDYKTDRESWQAAVEAGWRPETQFFDDYMHFQCMTVARNGSWPD